MDDSDLLRLLLAEFRRLSVQAGHVYRHEQLHWWHASMIEVSPTFLALDRNRAMELALERGFVERVNDPSEPAIGWRFTAAGADAARSAESAGC